MFKSTKCAAVLAGIPFALASTANAATTDVDLMFVIDHSGSMADEYNTLADNISNVLTGI